MTDPTPNRPTTPPSGLSVADLTVRQLLAIDAFHLARARESKASLPRSREDRLDLARWLEVQERQRAALIAHTDTVLRGEIGIMVVRGPRRVVLAHRNDWFRHKLRGALVERELHVVACVDNAPDAVGIVIAEQPDLLFIEDTLPMMTGQQVISDVQRFAPATLIAVQVYGPESVGSILDAGAAHVVTRQVPPTDVADAIDRLTQPRPQGQEPPA